MLFHLSALSVLVAIAFGMSRNSCSKTLIHVFTADIDSDRLLQSPYNTLNSALSAHYTRSTFVKLHTSQLILVL